jgi:uncharacterized membrane protein YecN with MAPEG domain
MTNNRHDITEIVKHHTSNISWRLFVSRVRGMVFNYFSYIVAVICHWCCFENNMHVSWLWFLAHCSLQLAFHVLSLRIMIIRNLQIWTIRKKQRPQRWLQFSLCTLSIYIGQHSSTTCIWSTYTFVHTF